MSKQIRISKTQVAVSVASALAAGTVFAADFNSDFPWYGSAQATDFVAVSYFDPNATPPQEVISGGTNVTELTLVPGAFNETSQEQTVYRIEKTGLTGTTEVTDGGSVLLKPNGDVVLTGATSSETVYSFAESTRWEITQTNEAVNVTYPVRGTYNPTADTFTEGQGTLVSQTTEYLGGGNLTMDGFADIHNGISVVTRTETTTSDGDSLKSTTTYGAPGSGAGRLDVTKDYAFIGARQEGMSGMSAMTVNQYDPIPGYNGVYVSPSKTVVKGGTASTTLTLSDSGAQFANTSGQPVVVTGVADGSDPYDAVNMRTFSTGVGKLNRRISDVENKSYAGIAAAVALAGIPAPAAGKQYTIGAGWGNYEGENAFALGGRAQVTPEIQLTAGWGYSSEGNAFNVGAGYSW